MCHLFAGPSRSLASTRTRYPDSCATMPEYARQHCTGEIPGIFDPCNIVTRVVVSFHEFCLTLYGDGVQVHNWDVVLPFIGFVYCAL